MLKRLLVGLFVCGTTSATMTAAPGVQLAIQDGRVWLSADHATVGQILAEWARVGRTQIVNGERVPGGPLTIELRGVAEQEALDVLLRSAGGFVAVARTAGLADDASTASRFGRILILTTGGRPADLAVRPAALAPQYPQPAAPPPMNTTFRGRVIGPDGLPVPDDQEDAPPQPTGGSMSPGFSEPPDAAFRPPIAVRPSLVPNPPKGTLVPGLLPPAQPPRRPGGLE
jgi:hypothetical protein